MNKLTLIHSCLHRTLKGLLLISPVLLCAQSVAPLGLPRLRDSARAGEPVPVARGKYAEEALAAPGAAGARSGEKRGAKFLALDAARDWSRPLRGNAKETGFVSFSVYGSLGTIIEVGGARLGIVDSDMTDYAQLVVDEPAGNGSPQWRELGIHVPLRRYDGQLLASLSVLTVRLDRTSGTWDLSYGSKLVAEDLILNPSTRHSQFIVKAGMEGAMVNGLVQSDENPLYADSNANGLDDDFEQQKQGRLLAASDSKAVRQELIAEWRKHQRTHRPAALFVNLPRPD
jgi:hypothetical protein